MENLMNPEHITNSEKYISNFEDSFEVKCIYHGTRKAVREIDGKPLCENCYGGIVSNAKKRG